MRTAEVALRAHRPGDMGWVVGAHGRLYAQEYGWDERFEALVAGIAAAFINELRQRSASAAGSRRWTASRSAACSSSSRSKTVAKLRLLIVEPRARGIGLGGGWSRSASRSRARRAIKSWCSGRSPISPRRAHIYKSTGFKLVSTQRHQDFGIKLTGEYWELAL